MSTYTGFDMAPSALRWQVRGDAVDGGKSGGPIYGIRGCPRHPDYDSAVSWSDAMAFRQGEFTAKHASGIERTVRYEEPAGHAAEWLRSFFRSEGERPAVDVNGSLAVAVPDHASPEVRDDVLAGLSGTKYANVSLVWRPVAALLSWIESKQAAGKDLEDYLGRRVFVLDLDGGRPELSQLGLARHRVHTDWIIPTRISPVKGTVAADDAFERTCYRETLAGVEEWEQLLGGQFYETLQRAIESGESGMEAWVRHEGNWSAKRIGFAKKLPQELLRELNPILKPLWDRMDAKCVLLVNGWIVRRYGEQILEPFRKRCGQVEVLPADSVAEGAALFAERLAKGLPTFYDRLAEYRFWDGFKLNWAPMFDCEQEVEPGLEYRYPAEGAPERILKIEKNSTNVSFYVRETSSEEYARRIKTQFSEFLRSDIEVKLSAVVSPEKGSARFMLTMADDQAPAIFVSGKTTTREIVLRWSDELNTNKSVTVERVKEHQGYAEPQPVLGRIYDNDANLKMVEEYVVNPGRQLFNSLWRNYSSRYRPDPRHGIADRVGYDAVPREPTRGLFGTQYVFNSRIDKATQAYAKTVEQRAPYLAAGGGLLKDGMLQQNYCHSSATPEYKALIRQCYARLVTPSFNFSYYNAPGYVLGDDPEDVRLLLKYICGTTHLQAERPKLWWSFFRMLCWHPECKLAASDLPLLESALMLIPMQDAIKTANGGRYAGNDMKYLPLAILYALRIRESGVDLSDQTKTALANPLDHGLLATIAFPPTMIPKIDPRARKPGDTLSAYVLRFLRFEDTLADRELGASMGGV